MCLPRLRAPPATDVYRPSGSGTQQLEQNLEQRFAKILSRCFPSAGTRPITVGSAPTAPQRPEEPVAMKAIVRTLATAVLAVGLVPALTATATAAGACGAWAKV